MELDSMQYIQKLNRRIDGAEAIPAYHHSMNGFKTGDLIPDGFIQPNIPLGKLATTKADAIGDLKLKTLTDALHKAIMDDINKGRRETNLTFAVPSREILEAFRAWASAQEFKSCTINSGEMTDQGTVTIKVTY